MKAILKKDFYENFKSIFVNIIFLILEDCKMKLAK